jgi:hypothetical protein
MYDNRMKEPQSTVAQPLFAVPTTDAGELVEIASRFLVVSPWLIRQPGSNPVYTTVCQKWQGCVLQVGKDTFTARLVSTLGEHIDHEFIAEIRCDQVDAEDQLLLFPGAVFYWSIGYYGRPSDHVRFSSIRMRRLPQWSPADLVRSEKTAEDLGRLLDGAVNE